MKSHTNHFGFSLALVLCAHGLGGLLMVNQAVAANDGISATVTADTVQLIAPEPNAIVDVAATNITLQYPTDTQLELRVNGKIVDAALIGRTETNTSKQQITQTWIGVALQEGQNEITATVSKNGAVMQTVRRSVQTRGSAAKIQLTTAETRVPADGRSTVTVLGELFDGNGNRSHRDAVVTLKPSAGEFVEPDANPEQPGYQVKAIAGKFTASLRTNLNPQTVRIQAQMAEIEAFTQVQFEPSLRPSLVTGSIDLRLGKRGTDFYSSLQEFLPPDGDNGYQVDAVGSIFATGKVGDWLVTGAYNSERNLNQTCDGTSKLFRDKQFCDQSYPVYGDSSKTEVLTPSIDSVFFKIERTAPGTIGTDYAMWGDYNTEEFATKSQQFTATTRPLHGFKANYNLGNLQVSGLYANNVEGFQRDTIAPDGTSGFYFLSRRTLVGGSENVMLELEELNRPGTVIEQQQLVRGKDYEIDYDRGTLLFKQPILRADIDRTGTVLVRRIVATYQYEGQAGDKSNIYAGRLRYHLSKQANQESWIGATYLRENRGVRDFELYGGDALFTFGNASVIAEYAHSTNNSDVVGLVSGSAYRLEANATIAPKVQVKGYFRRAETGFANNATISFVPGQTRYGAEISGTVGPKTTLRAQYDHEDNRGIAPKPMTNRQDLFAQRTSAILGGKVDNSLTTITAGVQQKIGQADLNVDYVHRDRTDRITPKSSGSSDQIRSRLTLPLAEKLTLTAQNETTLSSKTDAVYSDQTALGLNWAIMPGLSLNLGQQFFHRGQLAGKAITSLNLSGEYKLGADTTLNARYGILGGVDSWTTQGAIGLNQGWTIAPGLRLDATYEHLFGGLLGQTAAGIQFAQPFAVGQSAASLVAQSGDSYSVGIEYTGSQDFQASARYQYRSSRDGTNTVINAAATGKLSPALTAMVRYQQAGTANQRLVGLADTANLKVGLAYREPNDDRFNALLRYEYRKNPATTPDTILFGTGTGSADHLFGLEAVYAPNWRWEFYGKYALRRSTTFLASDFANSSVVSLGQLRATYNFSYSWDVTGEVRWLSQPSANFNELGLLLEAGYYLTPNLRLSAGYSFGEARDRDLGQSRSAGGLYLGLTVKLNELFDGFGMQKAVPKEASITAKTMPKNDVMAIPTAPVIDLNAPNVSQGVK
jgi:hypothetical protein